MSRQMDEATPAALQRAAMMGFVAGLRSQVPFLMLARAAERGEFAVETDGLLAWLRSPWAMTLLSAATAGEMIADKLPFIPNRTNPGPLFGRLAFGAAAGAAIALEARAAAANGAALGAAGALAGSFAGRYVRAFVVKALGVPAFPAALAEDGIALWLGRRVAQRPEAAPTSSASDLSQPLNAFHA